MNRYEKYKYINSATHIKKKILIYLYIFLNIRIKYYLEFKSQLVGNNVEILSIF